MIAEAREAELVRRGAINRLPVVILRAKSKKISATIQQDAFFSGLLIQVRSNLAGSSRGSTPNSFLPKRALQGVNSFRISQEVPGIPALRSLAKLPSLI